MSYQPFLIANPRVGLERDLEPFLIPQDAYPELEDAYLWRGRIKKKQGYSLLARLEYTIPSASPITLHATASNPALNITDLLSDENLVVTTGTLASTTTEVIRTAFPNAQIAPGTLVINIASGTIIFTDNGDGTLTGTPNANTGDINYATGKLGLDLVTVISGSSAVTVSFMFYPGLPVMGLPSLENAFLVEGSTVSETLLMAYDTSFSYLFNATDGIFDNVTYHNTSGNPAFTWQGTDSEFFWSYNYLNCMWVSNFNPGFQANPVGTNSAYGDGIRWFDQAVNNSNNGGWVNFLPPVESTKTTFLMGALIIVAYKGRLLCLNTWEGTSYAAGINYPQRARWSQIGTPFAPASAPVPTNFSGSAVDNAWYSDVASIGKGGYFDAPTAEQIISAQFVKDTLIVFFENSTWQLRYTGNELLPFAWEKINTELGALSTFSEVPFDKIVIGVGGTGIHGCDSVNVNRIDQKIPDEVFGIQNANEGRSRVYGIRDYWNQLVYWTFPFVGVDNQQAYDDEEGEIPTYSLTYPNRILVYSYIDEAYSYFIDSFTAFGYYQKQTPSVRWEDVTTAWQDSRFPWGSPIQQTGFPFIVAGNQQGFVELLDPSLVSNGTSLYASDVVISGTVTTFTVPNHNLTTGTTLQITNNSAAIGPGNPIYATITSVTDADTFTINNITFPGAFEGDVSIAVISNINIITKRFNPFLNEGIQSRLGYVDLYFDTTINGQVTVNLYINEDTTLPTNSETCATYPETTYTSNPDSPPYAQQKLWKRVYFEDISQLYQLQITLSPQQLLNSDVINSDIVLHGIILWFDKAGRLINV